MLLRVLLAGLVSLVPLVAAAQGEPVFMGVETRLTTNSGDQFDPAISGNLVVYTDERTTFDQDVWYVDILTGVERPVSTAVGDQRLTGISNGRIVYTDLPDSTVKLFDTATGITQNLTESVNSSASDPDIDGNWVVWNDDRHMVINENNNIETYARNLSTGEDRRISNSTVLDLRPSIHGNWIAWENCLNVDTNCDVYAYNLSTQETRQVTNTVNLSEKHVEVGEHTVVFQSGEETLGSDTDIVAYDLNTGEERRLVLPGVQRDPSISGDYVAFDEFSPGASHIKLWHLPSNSVFEVTSGTSQQFLSDIEGNHIVYTDDRNGQLDIYMTTFNVEFPPTAGTLSNTQLLINKRLKSFFLLSTFTLRPGHNGLNPPNEVVSFKIGNASATIPVGKFRKLGNTLYAYAGTINNVKMEVLIRSLGNNKYTFQTAGTGYNFSGIANPVNVEVSVGDDFATASVNANIR